MDRNNNNNVITADIVLLGAVCLISFFAGIGSLPLFDVDEGAFSEATREMLESGNYLTTYLNGEPRFDKPVLIYWLQLLSVRLFGITEFAFRLPSALASTAWTAAVYLFTRKHLGHTGGWTAAILMATAFQITIIGKAAIADALLNCLLAISMFAVYSYYLQRRERDILLAFAAIGLGTLTKGPVAILIPLAVSCIFFITQKETKAWFTAIFNPRGIALFCLIVLPWYTLEYLDQGIAFVEGFILKHNVGRFSDAMEKHGGPIWYYLPVLLIGILPATGLLGPMARHMKGMIKQPLFSFLLLWFTFVFVFFSLSGTKLHHYVIYGYTPVFILMAAHIEDLRRPAITGILPALLLGAFAALPRVIPAVQPSVSDPYVRAVLKNAHLVLTPGYSIQLLIAGLLIILIWALPLTAFRYRAAAAGAIFALTVNMVITPRAGILLQQPVKEAAMIAKERGDKIVMWKVNYPSFLVYSETFVSRRRPEPGETVFTSVKYIERLPEAEILYRKNGLVLARIPEAHTAE
ncbi:MAG: glycosyltransferase family 39 protein [Prosthecochloris sp.]|nr:glycosyltransferase family 39 protein [Prosthecochloris sp.]